MTTATLDSLSRTFGALADPTRRAILARLASGSATVGELATPFDMSLAAVSKHLKVLETAGLVTRSRNAQYRPRTLDAQPLAQASGWIEDYRTFWTKRFDALDGIQIDRELTAPPSAVFAAWTEATQFAQWFGGDQVDVPADTLDYNPIVGGSWSATMALPDGTTIDWAGDFLQITPYERFVFTLTDNPADPQRAEVVVELTPTQTGTRMRMTQETPGFTEEMRQRTLAGWQTFMDVLGRIAEET